MTRRYLLDAKGSRFTVQAFAAGVLSGFAHNPKFAVREFEGEMQFDPENASDSAFKLSVNAPSLELLDDVKEADRMEILRTMKDEVLEAGKYPQIAFTSAELTVTRIAGDWFRALIKGEMRLHGITKPATVDSQLRLADGELRLSGETGLALSDFKLKRVTALGGLIKLKDELKFNFDLLGHQQA